MGGRGRSEEMGGFNKSQPFWRRLNLLVSMACGRAVQGEAVCMCVCVCVCVCVREREREREREGGREIEREREREKGESDREK